MVPAALIEDSMCHEGERDKFKPDLIGGGVVQVQVAQAGFLGTADAVLAAVIPSSCRASWEDGDRRAEPR
uniref:hypothetical protein n=1 Tax=Actinomadura sp. CA-154981 TaxID=3240037 RepID=UPI003F495961